MHWKNDVLKYEKNLVFFAIVEFSKAFHQREDGAITIGEIFDFIDEFCENHYGIDKTNSDEECSEDSK